MFFKFPWQAIEHAEQALVQLANLVDPASPASPSVRGQCAERWLRIVMSKRDRKDERIDELLFLSLQELFRSEVEDIAHLANRIVDKVSRTYVALWQIEALRAI